jgi:hypothetical protein
MLTFFMTMGMYLGYRTLAYWSRRRLRRSWTPWLWVGASGLVFGLALLTKFSALLLLPMWFVLLLFFWPELKKSWFPWRSGRQFLTIIQKFGRLLLPLVLMSVIGLGCLYLLKFSPAFNQLFARGNDFLYSGSEFLARPGAIISQNLKLALAVLGNYVFGYVFLAAIILALACWRRERRPIYLLLIALAYLLPILFFGAVVYPRYFLPAVTFILLSFSLSLAHLTSAKTWLKLVLVGLYLVLGGRFMLTAWFKPAALPLTQIDRTQYFVEWSAGYGIKETVAFLQSRARAAKARGILVLTEGHIGTLPDGLQVYFFNQTVRDNLQIEGVGQPVKTENLDKFALQQGYPDFDALRNEYEQIFLVVNSHRLELDYLRDRQPVAEFARPDPFDPTLQIWQLK